MTSGEVLDRSTTGAFHLIESQAGFCVFPVVPPRLRPGTCSRLPVTFYDSVFQVRGDFLTSHQIAYCLVTNCSSLDHVPYRYDDMSILCGAESDEH